MKTIQATERPMNDSSERRKEIDELKETVYLGVLKALIIVVDDDENMTQIRRKYRYSFKKGYN